MIGEPLRILLVEDVPEDAELVLLEVHRLGVDFLSQRVDTREAFLEALHEFGPDLILCDYSMPSFDGMAALRLTREHSPGTPFIVVTGSLNEEVAVECMKEGAADYVLKDRMARLGPAVLAALERARAQREKELASATLRESEARYRLLAENASDVIWMMDLDGRFSYMSPSVESLLGFRPEEARKRTLDEMLTPTSAAVAWAELRDAQAQAAGGKSVEPRRLELEMRRGDGSTVWTEVTVTPVLGPGGALNGAQGVTRDISNRKGAQDTLKESESRFRELFQHTPVPVWEEDFSAVHAEFARLRSAGVDDFDFYLNEHPDEVARLASLIRIVDVNISSLEYFGATCKDELSLRLPDFFVETSWAVFRDEMVALAGGATRFNAETPIRTSAGEPRVVALRLTVVPGREHDLSRVLVSLPDVTEIRAAEEALRRSEANYRQLFERANDAIVVFEPDGETVLDANPQACAVYGYSRDELVGMSMKRLTKDVPRGERQIEGVLKAGGNRNFETVHLARDGREITFLVNASIAEYGGRKVVVSVNHDITERKRAEAERQRLAAAVEQAAEVIVITDVEGRIEYVNPAFERVTGYSREEAIGLKPSVLKSGRQDAGFYAALWQTILRGEMWRGRFVNRRKDGTLYEEDATISPIRDDSGAIVSFIAVKRDVTQEVALEGQLRQAQKMEAIGTLAGGVAHDFNNVLQVMLTYTQLLRNVRDDPVRAEAAAAELEQQITRGAALTRQLLLFSRRGTSRLETLDLNEVVRGSAQLLRRLLRENIVFRIQTSDEPLPVHADRGQLDQVLMNLAVNASDAMESGGILTIRTGAGEDSTVWLAVTDTGMGIAEEIREKIFEPFFTTKAVGKGTGLGLAVVHGIVDQHRGSMALESCPGEGTTFRITLPSAGESAHNAEERASPPDTLPRGGGERVLLVEDEPGARAGLAELLTSLGYAVTAAASGEEALALPAEPAFDLLLTDLMLPGIAGPDLARALCARWPAMRVVLMSGYTPDGKVSRTIGARIVRLLEKPFDMATLAREVHAVLQNVAAGG
jgi:two-component system cell cycle sensor histidine kinase/response regulator CckA